MRLRLREGFLELEAPVVMGVLNVTPDSFSDGGQFATVDAAVEHALRMVEEGAALIDVGGESTRPGAPLVSVETELDRVLPVIAAIVRRTQVPVSIDTRKPEVMRAAVAAGASLINDVSALQFPGALEAAASSGAAVCLMHMQGDPGSMQTAPVYADVVREVHQFLAVRVLACNAAGIASDRLVLDPGIGFGKRLEHNLTLLAHLKDLHGGGLPVMVGVSRKSLFGKLLARGVADRLAGGLAVATAAVLAGAKIIRTHDVAATVDAVRVAVALKQAGYQSSC
jgi:dihydropteroate synthase